MIHRLFLFNQKIRILFTISPVRHLREGVVENNRSKAALIQAVHQLVDKFEQDLLLSRHMNWCLMI